MLCNSTRRVLACFGELPISHLRYFHPQNNAGIMASFQMNESLSKKKQNFDYFLVLDFEATCDDKRPPKPQCQAKDSLIKSPFKSLFRILGYADEKKEIIEFPVLKVNASTCKVDSIFHQYVLPQSHPQLTPFCTELTGIVQDMVNDQPYLPEVLENFHKWMLSEKLLEQDVKSIFVTCGDWDLKVMLPKQCNYLGIDPQNYLKRWINIKRSFADMTGVFPKGMMPMLIDLHLKHTGRHHSGIDDCHNIANILSTMIQRGHVFQQH